MEKRKLEEYLREHGCELLRHGAKHDFWHNPVTGDTSSIPRHRTVNKNTARSICDDLGVPRPPNL
jgi:mRNA interferase HicA